MPISQRKPSKNSSKPIQSKLFNFTTRANSEASCDRSEANTSTCEAMEEENSKLNERVKTAESGSDAILAAIANLKSDFSSKLDGIWSAIENVKKEVNECAEREAEVRISAAEHSINSLQTRVQALENKNKDLKEKVLNLDDLI